MRKLFYKHITPPFYNNNLKLIFFKKFVSISKINKHSLFFLF